MFDQEKEAAAKEEAEKDSQRIEIRRELFLAKGKGGLRQRQLLCNNQSMKECPSFKWLASKSRSRSRMEINNCE